MHAICAAANYHQLQAYVVHCTWHSLTAWIIICTRPSCAEQGKVAATNTLKKVRQPQSPDLPQACQPRSGKNFALIRWAQDQPDSKKAQTRNNVHLDAQARKGAIPHPFNKALRAFAYCQLQCCGGVRVEQKAAPLSSLHALISKQASLPSYSR